MSTPPHVNKTVIAQVRATAGIASGCGAYDLANRLWVFEAELRARRDAAVVDTPTQLREDYMNELLNLVQYGWEKSPTKNGYLRGLRRALEVMGVPLPTLDEAFAHQEAMWALPVAQCDVDHPHSPFCSPGSAGPERTRQSPPLST